MGEKGKVEKLIAKHLLGIITDAEKEELKSWVESSPRHKEIFERLLTDTSFRKKYQLYAQIDSYNAWKRFSNKYHKRYFIGTTTFIRYAAILVLAILSAGSWYYLSTSPKQEMAGNFEASELIKPGIEKAILTLAENKRHELTTSSPTKVKVGQRSTAVAQNGTLIYPTSVISENVGNPEKIENNTLTTEEGNEFKVTFEDGTSVHLNYNTELRYPVRFSRSRRIVYLKGEAYFKIAKDSRPFYVVTEAGTIKQYGTEFNVNTFTPDRTKVVLVKGNISILSAGNEKEQHIEPGQLAYIEKGKEAVHISNVNITPYIAWNDGRLIFENRSLESIMEILENWYKVKISFGSPKLKQLHFTGNMDRYSTITPILRAIARTTNLHIQIQGREILITEN